VLRDADAAMYAAKRLGSGHRVLFEKGAGLTELDRPGLEEELREGLDRGQVQAAFQPVINLTTGAYAGTEALARWQHPTRGLIVASQFIVLAEDADVAADLDRAIIRAAAEQAAGWGFGATRPARMTVNLSPAGLDDERLLTYIGDGLSVRLAGRSTAITVRILRRAPRAPPPMIMSAPGPSWQHPQRSRS